MTISRMRSPFRNNLTARSVAFLTLFLFGLAAGQDRSGVDELIRALGSQDTGAREGAALSLVKQGEAAVPKLVVALKDGNVGVRRGAAYVLGELRSDEKDVIEGLTRLLGDEDRSVRTVAAHALGQIGVGAAAAVPRLVGLLKDTDTNVRKIAIQSLGEIRGAPHDVIRELLVQLRDQNGDVRVAAIGAIEKFPPKDVKPFLFELKEQLRDQNPEVRAGAASIIGSVGPEAAGVTESLIPLLKDNEYRVRLSAAQTLGAIGAGAEKAVPALTETLSDRDHDIRGQAASALGEMGVAAKPAIHALSELLSDEDRDVRRFAAGALSQAASALARAEDVNSIELLKAAETSLKNVKDDPTVSARGAAVSQAVNALQSVRSRRTFRQKARDFMRDHPFASVVMAFYIFLILFCLAAYFFKPIWLMQLNEQLASVYITLSLLGGTFTLTLRHLLLIGFFHYRPRVLDAWVDHHIDVARGSFDTKTTVEERQVYVPLPVKLDGEVTDLTVGHLQPLFSKNLACLLVQGEGGAGKTSLACHFGRWAMVKESDRRLCESHLMLPILIEGDFTPAAAGAGEEKFLNRVSDLVRGLTQITTPLSGGLIRQLLKHRRIVILIDGLSEMRDETREVIISGMGMVPVNAAVVTSRSDVLPTTIPKSTIKPLRIDKEVLLSFILPYLKGRVGENHELIKDHRLGEIRERLSAIIGDREITVLLAKLYLELIIAEQGGGGEDELPRNIPDLMLEYVKTIYRQSAPSEHGLPAVLRAAQAAAWRCVRRSYRPMAVKRVEMQAFLGPGERGVSLLRYLEEQLRLIQTTGAEQARVRFSLDPLAEYLAGLHVVAEFGEDEAKWREFLNRAPNQSGAPESTKDFLLAVRDSCQARAAEITVPPQVVNELRSLTGG